MKMTNQVQDSGVNAPFNKQRKGMTGFTMTELLIVMAIGGLLLAGIGLGVPKALATIRANGESSDMQTVFAASQKAYSPYTSYNGVTLAILINRNVFPSTWVTSATTVANRWSGSVTAAAATVTTANDSLAITSTSYPDFECKEVIPNVDSLTKIITVNGTVVKANGAQTDLATLGTACSTGANTIVYTIGK